MPSASMSIKFAAFARAVRCICSWLRLKHLFLGARDTAFYAATLTHVPCRLRVSVDAKCAPVGGPR